MRLTHGCPIAIYGDEIGEVNFQTCPLLQQAGGRRVSRRDSVLAGADVCIGFYSPFFPCWLKQRGFFIKRFQTISPGVQVAVVVWRFW
jgi:hypothetical protein